jgi:predicted DNA repair protein MutK
MPGLIGYIGALADDLSVIATKVAAGSLDDIASQTAKSLPQTAGILIDDAATIPQYVSDTTAKRELPVVWKIAKKSLRNKALMIPVAILITYFAPWLMAPILVLGGSYLAFEGSESLGEKVGLIEEHEHAHEHSIPDTDDLAAAEDATVNSAVRTDTILSIEIIALTIASVVNEPIIIQIGVLILIGLIATIGVYGSVGLIIKMDDVGLHLRQKYPDSKVYSLIGKMLILGMPKVMKALGWIGVVAMLMVGGGILLHNLPFLHELNHLGVSLPSVLPIFMEYFVTPITIALSIGAGILAFKRLLTSKHN